MTTCRALATHMPLLKSTHVVLGLMAHVRLVLLLERNHFVGVHL